MRVQSGFAEVNGTRLYYEVAGSGHPLVLIQGSVLDNRMWDDQFEPFARQYRVVRYDVRGYGKSTPPTHETYLHHDDLLGLMDHLGLDRAHVLGLSMGGGIAIDFALTYPERTGALIPVSSVLGGYEGPPEDEKEEKKPKRTVDVYRESGLEAAREHVYQAFRPGIKNTAILRQIIDDYSGWHLSNEDPAGTPDPPPVQRLEDIKAPTLVVVGEQDGQGILSIADLLENGVAGARKVVMSGVGHLLSMQDPQRFNDVVLEFLGGLETP